MVVEGRVRDRDELVRVVGVDVLAEPVHHVDAEAVHPPVQPEFEYPVKCSSHMRIRPVQVWLLWQMQVQVPLRRSGIEGPRGPAKGAGPVVRRPAARRRVPPEVPVTLRTGPR